MVQFQIASDLHIETLSEVPSVLSYITPKSDILILAGDVGRIHKFEQLKQFLTEVCSQFKTVIYILGNHEYYMEDGYDPRPMYALVESLNTLKILLPNLRILNRELFVIDDVCIAGCTLWSRPYVNPYIVRIHGMNYRKYAHLHKTDLNFIENAMQFAKAKSLKLVVVSHYCPSLSLLKKIKPNDRFWSLYASNLDHLLTSKSVHTWIYGHTHFNCDVITEGGTRVVSNQRGKKKDNIRTFALDKVIEV